MTTISSFRGGMETTIAYFYFRRKRCCQAFRDYDIRSSNDNIRNQSESSQVIGKYDLIIKFDPELSMTRNCRVHCKPMYVVVVMFCELYILCH